MTKDEIKKMAREVDAEAGFQWCVNFTELERFAALVAEKEREACAKVCDDYAMGPERNYSEIIADAIRARGNK